MRRRGRAGGFSVIEVMVVMAVSGILLIAIYSVFVSMFQVDQRNQILRSMREDAIATSLEVTKYLKWAGNDTVDNPNYPFYFQDGGATGAYSFLAHAPAPHTAKPGDSDFGPTREIAFKIAQFKDSNGNPAVPFNVTTGKTAWSQEIYAVVLVVSSTGTNEVHLVRYSSTGSQLFRLPLARGVERLYVADQSVNAALGANELQLSLYFRRRGQYNETIKYQYVTSTNFRSTTN